mgnify:FL=1
MIEVTPNYFSDQDLRIVEETIEEIGKEYYGPEHNPVTGKYNLTACNVTLTVPEGYNKFISQYQGLSPLNNILCSECNILHLIFVKMKTGEEIAIHQDETLNDLGPLVTGPLDIIPLHSSLLYVKIPDGGHFFWNDDDDNTNYLTPETNMFVRFPGEVWHGVTSITKCSSNRRFIVCEQYKLSKRNLRKVQEYNIPKIEKG